MHSTKVQGPCLGVIPAPPSPTGNVINLYTILNLSASVNGSLSNDLLVSLSGAARRIPKSQSFTLTQSLAHTYQNSSTTLGESQSLPRLVNLTNKLLLRANSNKDENRSISTVTSFSPKANRIQGSNQLFKLRLSLFLG